MADYISLSCILNLITPLAPIVVAINHTLYSNDCWRHVMSFYCYYSFGPSWQTDHENPEWNWIRFQSHSSSKWLRHYNQVSIQWCPHSKQGEMDSRRITCQCGCGNRRRGIYSKCDRLQHTWCLSVSCGEWVWKRYSLCLPLFHKRRLVSLSIVWGVMWSIFCYWCIV